MMGEGTWNVYSNYSNKYHCVTSHIFGCAWIKEGNINTVWKKIIIIFIIMYVFVSVRSADDSLQTYKGFEHVNCITRNA
jgi:hypothetical protein